MVKTGWTRKQWLADGVALVGLASVLLAVAVVVRDQRISANGSTAVGTVTEKQMFKGGSEDPDTYDLRYSFSAGAQGEFRGTASVEFSTYSKAKAGDTLTIEYASDDPSNNRIAGNAGLERWRAPFEIFVTGAVWFGVFGIRRWVANLGGEPDPVLEW
jgi:hypothetical protein